MRLTAKCANSAEPDFQATMQVIYDCSNHIIIDDQSLDHHYRQQKHQQNQSETLGFDLILHLLCINQKTRFNVGDIFPQNSINPNIGF